MEILGLEKVSLVDYEGKICATIFAGGCNYRCPFCHNSGIVEKKFDAYDEKEIFEYLEKRKGVLDAVTVSGGEPTLQPDLFEFIKKIKNIGYLVKLDTNGTMPEVVERLLKANLIDYAAIDIKNNFEDYHLLTAVKNSQVEKIKKTLSLLKSYQIDYELRTTLIADFHDISNIEKLSIDLEDEKILYLQKFVDNGTCFSNKLQPISKKQAQEFQDILTKTIKKVVLRGYN